MDSPHSRVICSQCQVSNHFCRCSFFHKTDARLLYNKHIDKLMSIFEIIQYSIQIAFQSVAANAAMREGQSMSVLDLIRITTKSRCPHDISVSKSFSFTKSIRSYLTRLLAYKENITYGCIRKNCSFSKRCKVTHRQKYFSLFLGVPHNPWNQWNPWN